MSVSQLGKAYYRIPVVEVSSVSGLFSMFLGKVLR